MTQHLGSFNNVFINNTCKLKNKQGKTQPHFVLNLQKTCVFFSTQQNNENIYLKKPTAVFVNTLRFFLFTLLIDFIGLIRQKIVKNGCFIYKKLLKRNKVFQKMQVLL